MKLINDVITHLLDPNIYYSRFSFLESGIEAINIKYEVIILNLNIYRKVKHQLFLRLGISSIREVLWLHNLFLILPKVKSEPCLEQENKQSNHKQQSQDREVNLKGTDLEMVCLHRSDKEEHLDLFKVREI